MAIKITDFIEIDEHLIFGSMKKYLAYNLSKSQAKGHIMELGVWKGATINHIADLIAPRMVYGFDSFEGLPQSWTMSEDISIDAGYFAVKELPKVRKNVELVKGLFSDTLAGWIGDNPGDVSLLHLDCDIYSSTATALTELNTRIIKGTIIVFDDMYSWQDEDDYLYWRRGQWKALREWMKEYDRDVEVVARMRRRHSCSVIVTK